VAAMFRSAPSSYLARSAVDNYNKKEVIFLLSHIFFLYDIV